MKILIAKFSAWSYEDYKTSQHPEYVAIRNIISRNPQSKFVLVGEGYEFKHFRCDGIEFYNINSRGGVRYFFSSLLKFELATLLRPSIIVVMGSINMLPFGLSRNISRARLIPVLTSEIGYDVQRLPHPFQMIFRGIFRAMLNHSSAILTLSKRIGKELIDQYQIDPSRITIYRHKMSKIFHPQVSKDIKATLNPDGPVVLTLCRISQEKGLEFLIEAAKDIVNRVPNVRIVIKGSSNDQKYKDRLTKLVHQYSLDNRLVFLEFSPYSEVPKFLSASDVFVLPSISEGVPTVLLEAMATGIPVVATNVGGVPDIIEDGRNGLLVSPRKPSALAEAVVRLLSDAGLRERLRKKGFQTVQQQVRESDIEELIMKFISSNKKKRRDIK
jgi:glycosyltransferase involved in cell wall biosynthesis